MRKYYYTTITFLLSLHKLTVTEDKQPSYILWFLPPARFVPYSLVSEYAENLISSVKPPASLQII